MAPIVFALICLVLIFGGLSNYFYYKIKAKKYYKTSGTIVSYEIVKTKNIRTGDTSSIYYHPVVEYQDKNGNIQQIVSEDGNSRWRIYPIGTKIALLVHPTDKRRILFDDPVDKWQVPLIVMSAGFIGLIVISCVLIFSPPNPQTNPDNQGLEIITNDSAFQQLPQNVKDSVLSILKKNHH